MTRSAVDAHRLGDSIDRAALAMDDHDRIQIGLIGLGEMGRMYAERLHRGGWKRCVAALDDGAHRPQRQRL